jgi:hypothetical protein
MLRYLLPLLLGSSSAWAQSNLVAIPTHPTAGIALSWTGPAGTNTIQRWTDANTTPVTIGTSTTTTYTDTTPTANLFYYYQVINGATTSNSAMAIVADSSVAFPCPPIPQAPNQGVDRTETYTNPDGTTTTFTVHVPRVTTPVINITPCNGATGCNDYTNINNAITTLGMGGGTINLAAGNYYVDCSASGCFAQVFLVNVQDVTLAGAGLDANGIPTTHLYGGQSGSMQGLVVGGPSNRVLVKNITFDTDRYNTIPGVVRNVVDATITATLDNAGFLNVTAINSGGAIVIGAPNMYGDHYPRLFDAAGAIGAQVQITMPPAGGGTGIGTYLAQPLAPNLPPNVISTPTTMTVSRNQRFYVQSGQESYYVPDPTNPPSPIRLTGYNFTGNTYELRGGGRDGVDATPFPPATNAFNPNFFNSASPDYQQYFWSIENALNLPNNLPAIMFIKTGQAGQIGVVANDTTWENVHLYGGGGPGLILPKATQNVRLTNFKVTRTPNSILRSSVSWASGPEQPRYAALIGDNDQNNTWGNVVIENSEFGFIEDDYLFSRGPANIMAHVYSTTHFDAYLLFQATGTPSSIGGDTAKIYDQQTYQVLGEEPVSLAGSATMPCSGGSCGTGLDGFWLWDFVLSTPIPKLRNYIGATDGALPVFGLPAQSAPNLIIRNSCFHDGYSRLLTMNRNVLYESNTFGNNYFQPIEISAYVPSPTAVGFYDGPGSINVTVTGNRFVNSPTGGADLAAAWAPVAVTAGYTQTGWAGAPIYIYGIQADGFFASGSPHPLDYINVTNNFFSQSPGLAVSVNSADHVNVTGNTIVDANTLPYAAGFQTAFCGRNSHGQTAGGAHQPWCLAKEAAQGAILISNSGTVNYSMPPNTFLGTTSTMPSVFLVVPPTPPAGDMFVGQRYMR